MKKTETVLIGIVGAYLFIPVASKIISNANTYWSDKSVKCNEFFYNRKNKKIYNKMIPIWLERGLIYKDDSNGLYYNIKDKNRDGFFINPVTFNNYEWEHHLPIE